MIEDAMKIKNYVEKAAIAGTNMMKKEDLWRKLKIRINNLTRIDVYSFLNINS